MKARPLIGVLPLYDETKESIWMVPGYLECLQKAGALPIILPQTLDEQDVEQMIGECSGFMFTGGHDVNPALYGEQPLPECGVWNDERDRLETALFNACWERDIPMFGICRGIQFFNAVTGGTLYQDLPSQRDSRIGHAMKPPYDRVCHQVQVLRNTPLMALLGTETLGVNSYHHQAIKKLSNEFREMARSEDGLVEGIYAPSKRFVWGIQWHPEFCYRTDANAQSIVEEFVRHCL